MGNEIQSGYPQLPKDYWKNDKNKDLQTPFADINTNYALEDLSKISVFKSKK